MAIPDKYKILNPIGEGFFARVVRCLNTITGEELAMKRLKPSHFENEDSVRRFKKEIELLEYLAGVEGVLGLLDVIDDGEDLAYVMPLGSQNLYSYIKANNTKLDLAERVEIFDQILNTMRSAHESGVLHRDISPQNIIVFESKGDAPGIRVCDFGLGKSLDAATAYTRTSVGGIGYVYYVAPEQLDSLKNATVHSDIHALGKLLNFVMTGKDPDRHYNCEFSVVIRKATQEVPGDRYQSLAEFQEVYEAIKELRFDDAEESGELEIALLEVGDDVDWHAFHKSAIDPSYQGHVYHGYLGPVIAYLLHEKHLEEYYDVVGGDISQFVEILIDCIDDCIGTVGWPFSATGSFGRILERIMFLVPDENIQISCAEQLWDIAYGGDQWDVKKIVLRLFRERLIPEGIETSLALHIKQAGISVDLEQFAGMKLPQVIRNAIARLDR